MKVFIHHNIIFVSYITKLKPKKQIEIFITFISCYLTKTNFTEFKALFISFIDGLALLLTTNSGRYGRQIFES